MRVEDIKEYLKKWPRLYQLLIYLSRTIFLVGLGPKQALDCAFGDQALAGKQILNLGSGTGPLKQGIINVDIQPYPTVQVVADASNLPFGDNSIDMIVSESLLEHVPYPEAVIAEIRRVLKPGGWLYISLPFVYPFHGSPNDYTRFTLEGLKARFHDFEVIRAGARSGPFTALVIQTAYTAALLFSFGSAILYPMLLSLFLIILSPFKLFDLLFSLYPWAEEAASQIYFFARKR